MNENGKENAEKLAKLWMYTTRMERLPKTTSPVVLIPAQAGSTGMLSRPPIASSIFMLPATEMHSIRGVPPMRANSMLHVGYLPSLYSIPGSNRTQKSPQPAHMRNRRRQHRRTVAQLMRLSKMGANRRPRSKSEADVTDRTQTFQYTGLDKEIADSFLAQQEQSQTGSHIDYSSSSSSETYANEQQAPKSSSSRASSKTKIFYRDVI